MPANRLIVSGINLIVGELFYTLTVEVDPSGIGAYPNITVCIFEQAGYTVVAQGVGVGSLAFIAGIGQRFIYIEILQIGNIQATRAPHSRPQFVPFVCHYGVYRTSQNIYKVGSVGAFLVIQE